MATTKVFAPAKINLTLHVTGQREDGYHLLDSYVVFADVGDRVTVAKAEDTSLTITGPMAEGVPADPGNLCWRAADAFGQPVAITLEKHLPMAAGIGGGSSDAAATLKAMEKLYNQPAPFDPITLGADVPVCMVAHAAHMQGIGDWVLPLYQEPLNAVLVNPRIAVSTPEVFRALPRKDNPPMTPWPEGGGFPAVVRWLSEQRNDLQAPAIALQPVIGTVLSALDALQGCALSRMSGSGATCFALFATAQDAQAGAARLAADHPDWWVTACALK
ncbi:4-(cytidine 5'-diphospho)-2-C-methyl-D-erythritol kinase [Mesobacterium sp. TK19101]|uniref:4-diphosphocytidyl-2-C-methyl-D-erythritol kinase n=1 Tax=Mesobacterium hydrothermale TaxID=3111907 RepID=A0ABU6HD30_9RHOB|nr:4-(cytidine 5'-diphospho)-2-C-methyl-D-erythritol kinase [Mesobacterium sp. TK19101]MEC3859896.1 4-(cytidine 5'-diphospho)-2-C-methyl-D-erythritol kinase [Mesobacterium sp. TK19101]